MTAATVPAQPEQAQPKQKQPKVFGFSSLIWGIGRVFRGFGPLIVVIVVNALIQALLIGLWDPTPTVNFGFLIAALASFIVLVESYHAINVIALEAATGKPRLASYLNRTGKQRLRFLGWAFLVYVLVLIGLIVNTYLGMLILALLAYVPVIATDTDRSPVITNFKTIGNRPIRWLVTVIITGIMLIFAFLFAALNGFFIGGQGYPLNGFVSSFVAWICWGFIAAWWTSALALIYRSTRAGALPDSE